MCILIRQKRREREKKEEIVSFLLIGASAVHRFRSSRFSECVHHQLISTCFPIKKKIAFAKAYMNIVVGGGVFSWSAHKRQFEHGAQRPSKALIKMIIKYYLFFLEHPLFLRQSSFLFLASLRLYASMRLRRQPILSAIVFPPCALLLCDAETTNAALKLLSNFQIIPIYAMGHRPCGDSHALPLFYVTAARQTRPQRRRDSDSTIHKIMENEPKSEPKRASGRESETKKKKLITRYELVEIEFCVRRVEGVNLKKIQFAVGIYVGARRTMTRSRTNLRCNGVFVIHVIHTDATVYVFG